MSGQPGQQAAAAERGFPPPQPGTPPGYSPDAAPGRPASRGTNGFAIASFIFGLIGGILLGVIFGIIALTQIRRRQQGGRGLAIAGLVLSGVWTVVAAAAIIAVVALTAHRSGTGQITKGGTVSIFSLRVGDCFQNPPGGSQLTVQTVTAVPCSTPHNAQTFAAFTATGTSYPGTAALIRQAGQGCQARVAGDLDRSKLTRTMSLRFLFPERQSWSDGRRTITCLVEDSSADLTSSLLAAHPAG